MNLLKRSILAIHVSAIFLTNVCGTKAEEPSITEGLISSIRKGKTLDDSLQLAYAATKAHVGGIKFTAFKEEIKASGGHELFANEGEGRSRLLVNKGFAKADNGLRHDLAVDITFNPGTGEVVSITPIFIAVISKPIVKSKFKAKYSFGSVVARALALPAIEKEAKNFPYIVNIEISYSEIGWPSNPIRGRGYLVSIELGNLGSHSSVTTELAAFTQLTNADIGVKLSLISRDGTKLFNIPDFESSMLDEKGVVPAFILIGQEIYNAK